MSLSRQLPLRSSLNSRNLSSLLLSLTHSSGIPPQEKILINDQKNPLSLVLALTQKDESILLSQCRSSPKNLLLSLSPGFSLLTISAATKISPTACSESSCQQPRSLSPLCQTLSHTLLPVCTNSQPIFSESSLQVSTPDCSSKSTI